MYHVIDVRTNRVIRRFPADKARQARAYAHDLDAVYGAVRYAVRYVV